MRPCTRRRALGGAAALLAALAGCSGSVSKSGGSNAPGAVENVETDPESYALRNPRDEPAVWLRSEDDGETRRSDTGDGTWLGARTEALIASRSTADRLAFADVEGIDGARSFVRETEFDRETLLVDPERVGECFALELCYVTWSATEYHTYYARRYRDVDVACSADRRDGTARLVRIPDALDPERVTSRGSGTTSRTCYSWEGRGAAIGTDGSAERDGNSTEAASGGG